MEVTENLIETFGNTIKSLIVGDEIELYDLLDMLYDANVPYEEILAYFGKEVVAEYIYQTNKEKNKNRKRLTLDDLEEDIDINECSIYYG